jgi:hypothetical protein
VNEQKRFQPVPFEDYRALDTDRLQNKYVWLCMALKAVDQSDGHPDQDRARRFYRQERDKCLRALNLSKIADGYEPPPIIIGMQCAELGAKAMRGGDAALPKELAEFLEKAKEVLEQHRGEPLAALPALLRLREEEERLKDG